MLRKSFTTLFLISHIKSFNSNLRVDVLSQRRDIPQMRSLFGDLIEDFEDWLKTSSQSFLRFFFLFFSEKKAGE